MKILYAVQRYHESIVGGSENACRQFAERLAARGHDVEVVTSCALDYRSWTNVLEPGITHVNGVTVHRLPTNPEGITSERKRELSQQSFAGPRPLSLKDQRDWLLATGPNLVGYENWIRTNSTRFDVAVFMTYLYGTTTRGLPAAKGLVPIVLQPTAHDEAPIWLSMFDFVFKLADSLVYFTPEEQQFVGRRFRTVAGGAVIGYGFETPSPTLKRPLNTATPNLVYVGRWDRAKGVERLVQYVGATRSQLNIDLRLVIVGEEPPPVGLPNWVHALGYLSEQDKAEAIQNALALVQPSYFESFSIVLFEAWSQGRPVIVQERCDVLRGQVERSGGGSTFRSQTSFIASVERLLYNETAARLEGAAGCSYVREHFSWPDVVSRLERHLTSISTTSKRKLVN